MSCCLFIKKEIKEKLIIDVVSDLLFHGRISSKEIKIYLEKLVRGDPPCKIHKKIYRKEIQKRGGEMKKIILIIFLLYSAVFASEWRSVDQVDEFGDKTGAVTIVTSIERGTFTDTVTRDSKLEGFIKVGANFISFNTYEYGYSRGVKSHMKDITVKMKNSDNKILNMRLNSMYAFDFPQYKSYDADKIKNFMKKSNGEIKVVIYGNNSKVQKFTFNLNGYIKKLELIKDKVVLEYRDGIAYEKNKKVPYTGEWTGYYKDGEVLVDVNYKDGKRNGTQIIYDKNGDIQFRTTFKDGKVIEK